MSKRSLGFERLEHRLLLAGDVKWVLSRAGDLTITGDQAPARGVDESIEIVSLGNATYEIKGLEGTTVKGAESVVIPNVTRNVIVDLKNGNDRVQLSRTEGGGGFAKDVTLKMGNGNDIVEATDLIFGGKLTVDMGAGDAQKVTLKGGSVAQDVSIKAGNGNGNNVLLENAAVTNGKLTVTMGNGSSQSVELKGGSVARDVSIKTGNGSSNKVLLDGAAVTNGKLTVTMGTGSDQLVELKGGSVAYDVSLKTGNGDSNKVSLDRATLTNGKLTVTMGTGSDQKVTLKCGSVARDVSLKTGNGNRNEVSLDHAAVTTGKLTVTTGVGSGQKVVLRGGSVAYDVSLKTGNGNGNEVRLEKAAVINGKLTVTTGIGSGQEVILKDGKVAGPVSISTGKGNDDVWLRGLTLGATLTVNTGDGFDRVGIVDSKITGNISISTGNDNDQVGLLRVSTANITVNGGNGDYRLGGTKVIGGNGDVRDADYGDRIGLAGVTAAHVTLDGGDGGTRRTPGLSEIGVTGSTIGGNLTIKSGNGIDQVGIGNYAEIKKQLGEQLVDPDKEPVSIDNAVGATKVSGVVSINTGNYSGDYVALNKLEANVLRVNMGPDKDTVMIGEELLVTQEATINTGGGNDTLQVHVALDELLAGLPARRLIDGGAGSDTLKSKPIFTQPLDAVFKNWEKVELL